MPHVQTVELAVKPDFHLDLFFVLLLVLVFGTNKKPKRAMQCSNWNIYKKPKRAIKSQNGQPKAFACSGFWDRTDSVSKTRTSTESSKKPTIGKWKQAPKTKTSNKEHLSVPFSFIHANSGPMKVVDIKSNEKPESAIKRATKSSKNLRRAATDIGEGKAKTSNKNQNEQRKAQKSKWKPGFIHNKNFTKKSNKAEVSCQNRTSICWTVEYLWKGI